MHAKFCVNRPNGVGVVFTEDRRHTEDTQKTHTQKTDRMKIHAPFSALGPSNCSKLQCGNKDHFLLVAIVAQHGVPVALYLNPSNP